MILISGTLSLAILASSFDTNNTIRKPDSKIYTTMNYDPWESYTSRVNDEILNKIFIDTLKQEYYESSIHPQ